MIEVSSGRPASRYVASDGCTSPASSSLARRGRWSGAESASGFRGNKAASQAGSVASSCCSVVEPIWRTVASANTLHPHSPRTVVASRPMLALAVWSIILDRCESCIPLTPRGTFSPDGCELSPYAKWRGSAKAGPSRCESPFRLALLKPLQWAMPKNLVVQYVKLQAKSWHFFRAHLLALLHRGLHTIYQEPVRLPSEHHRGPENHGKEPPPTDKNPERGGTTR